MKKSHWNVAVAIAMAAGLAPLAASSARADPLAYEATADGSFGIIDLSTGIFTLRGNSGLQLAGLGSMTFGGTLYAGATRGNTLYSVDPSNGAVTAIGTGTISYYGFGTTTTGLYGYGFDNNLYSINETTGVSTVIGSTGVTIAGGYFGFSSGGASLYELVNGNTYVVNTSTGVATLVGSSATGAFGAAVFIGDTLYAGSETPLAVYTIDTATGAGTPIAAETGTSSIFYGLAAASTGVPEPSGWVMMIGGVGLVGGVLRRRRKVFARPRYAI